MQRNSAGGLYGARGARAPGRHWITVRLKEEGGERVRVFIQARGAEFARFRVVEQRAHDVAPRNVVDGLRAQAGFLGAVELVAPEALSIKATARAWGFRATASA